MGNGNRQSAGYLTGTNNETTSDGTYNYVYDTEGNRTLRTHIASGSVTEYEWDHRNRLAKLIERDTAGGPATKTVEYRYDPFNRRIAKVISPVVGPANVEHFIYDGAGSGVDGDQNATLRFDSSSQVVNRYLHGHAIDMILADEQSSGGGTNVLWPLTDNLGTVRDVADVINGATTIVNHLVYNAFGTVTSETNPAIDVIFGYTGREMDPESDLFYYRARYYDPGLGQFTSEDPIGFEAGDANVRRYVGNSPTNATDPSGLDETIREATPYDTLDQMTWAISQGGFDARVRGLIFRSLAGAAVGSTRHQLRRQVAPNAAADLAHLGGAISNSSIMMPIDRAYDRQGFDNRLGAGLANLIVPGSVDSGPPRKLPSDFLFDRAAGVHAEAAKDGAEAAALYEEAAMALLPSSLAFRWASHADDVRYVRFLDDSFQSAKRVEQEPWSMADNLDSGTDGDRSLTNWGRQRKDRLDAALESRPTNVAPEMQRLSDFAKSSNNPANWPAYQPSTRSYSVLESSKQWIEAPRVGRRALLDDAVGVFSDTAGEPMDPALFSRIQTAWERKPGRIMLADENSAMHLNAIAHRARLKHVGGQTLNENVIFLQPNPTATSVFEELIHTTQLRRGMNPKTQVVQMEIEAAEKLIRNRRPYRIPNAQTRDTISRLRILREEAGQ